jgi:hypothetical protein
MDGSPLAAHSESWHLPSHIQNRYTRIARKAKKTQKPVVSESSMVGMHGTDFTGGADDDLGLSARVEKRRNEIPNLQHNGLVMSSLCPLNHYVCTQLQMPHQLCGIRKRLSIQTVHRAPPTLNVGAPDHVGATQATLCRSDHQANSVHVRTALQACHVTYQIFSPTPSAVLVGWFAFVRTKDRILGAFTISILPSISGK